MRYHHQTETTKTPVKHQNSGGGAIFVTTQHQNNPQIQQSPPPEATEPQWRKHKPTPEEELAATAMFTGKN
jgi:hypothetical protein